MPRRKLLSDASILDGALKVMFARGPSDFTLADVAEEVGVAPATLLQRFGSKRKLIVRAVERDNTQFARALIAAPPAPGAEGVIVLFLQLTPDLGPQDGSVADQLLWLREDFRDPELNDLAKDRFRVLRQAAAGRMPALRVPPAAAVRLIEAQWQGALNQWGMFREGRLHDYVRRALRDWFALAGAH